MLEVKAADTRGAATALATFASNLEPRDLSPEAVAHAKLCILDAVGCGLYGSTLEWTRLLSETIADVGGPGSARVWGTRREQSADGAALINGTAVHSFELDDLHKTAIMHPGGVTLPPLVALVETGRDASGERLLTALVAGYEVGIRVGLVVGLGLLHRGWHNNGVLGTFSAAAAAGNLLELDPQQMDHALGMAATQAGGLMAAQYGAMVKRFHAGRAAQSGLYAAALAKRGFTGIADVFEDRYGNFLNTFADEFDRSRLEEGLGEQWEITNVGFKWYPACGSSHTSIDAVLQLREQHGVRAEDVEACVIDCSTATRDHVGWPYVPDSVTTAQMNLPYAVAVALMRGAVTVDDYRADVLLDPDLIDLAGRVTTKADPAIDAKGPRFRHAVRLTLRLRDGQSVTVSVDHAKGSEYFPLTEEELRTKFRGLAAHGVGEERAAEIENAIDNLDQFDSAATFAELLAAPGVE